MHSATQHMRENRFLWLVLSCLHWTWIPWLNSLEMWEMCIIQAVVFRVSAVAFRVVVGGCAFTHTVVQCACLNWWTCEMNILCKLYEKWKSAIIRYSCAWFCCVTICLTAKLSLEIAAFIKNLNKRFITINVVYWLLIVVAFSSLLFMMVLRTHVFYVKLTYSSKPWIPQLGGSVI